MYRESTVSSGLSVSWTPTFRLGNCLRRKTFYLADFDLDGKPDNISFMIKRIKVHTKEALKDPKYRFPGNYGVEKFLEIFSGQHFMS